jgi:MoaA/NifB/PqqE/SkfB family radical SAM enzyme
MTKILIVHPPVWVSADAVDVPPFTLLGALDLLGVLRRAGVRAELIDALVIGEISQHERALTRIGARVDEVLARVRSVNSEWVAIQRSPYHRLRRNVDEVLAPLIAGAAALGRRVLVFDGHLTDIHYVSDDPSRVLARHVDLEAVVLRESGGGVLALLEGRAHATLTTREFASAPPMDHGATAELDGPMPFDALDLPLTLERLRALSRQELLPDLYGDEAIFPLLTSRGCPFSCRFCTREDGRPWAARSLDVIEQEVRALRRAGVERVLIVDPIANLDTRRFEALLSLLTRLGVGVGFSNGLRGDRLPDEVVDALTAICREITVSVESADPEVNRDRVDKRLDMDALERAVSRASSAGARVSAHYLIGIPGETLAQANRTLVLAADWLDRYGARPLVQYFVPATRFRVPPDEDALPDDFYTRFGRPDPDASVPPEQLAVLMDVATRKREEKRQAKLIVNLSYLCNNNCVFCSVGDRARADGDFDTQVAHIREARAQGVRLLDLDGGEPTLYPRLFELLDEVDGLGFDRVTITTNGRRLAYRPFAERLASRGVQLLVSLHGASAAVHEGLTRARGSFAQTLRGVRNAAARFERFGVNTTVVRENVEELPKLAALLHRLGVRRWTLQYLTPFGNAVDEQVVAVEDARRVFAAVLTRYGAALGIGVIGMPCCYLPGFEAFVLEDHHKMARDMLFVDGERVNLGAYLQARRSHIPASCDPCLYRSICGGFWSFEGRGP